MNFFNQMQNTNPYDWNMLRENAPKQSSLFQSVLNGNAESITQYLTRPRKIAQEEIDASLFAAFTLGHNDMVQQIFPYAATSGVEAGKFCLIGSTYVNDLNLFNETALWLKKHGENALKKKDVRNHCLINLSAFNHVDKVQELLKISKSTLKNNSAVEDFCSSIAYSAARYGSTELLELSLPIAYEYFKHDRSIFEHILSTSIVQSATMYSSDTAGKRALTTDAHNQSFQWMIDKYESQHFFGVLRQSCHYDLDVEHTIEVLKRFDKKRLKMEMAALSIYSHTSYEKIKQIYQEFLNHCEKETIVSHIGSSGISSNTRKM